MSLTKRKNKGSVFLSLKEDAEQPHHGDRQVREILNLFYEKENQFRKTKLR